MRSFVCAVFVTSLSLFGQSATTPAGHWEGTIDLPQKQVRVAADLVQNPDGKWAGSVGFPDLGGTAARLTSIIVKGAMVSVQSMEALCALDGTVAADGSTIKGEFVSALLRSVPVPMRLKRVGEARLKPPAGNGSISGDVQGVWEGALRIPRTWEGGDPPEGTTLQLRIRLAAGEGGATGIFPNQKTESPITGIAQDGRRVQFEVKASGAFYKAELKGGELTGQWSQFNSDPVSLTLKRVR